MGEMYYGKELSKGGGAGGRLRFHLECIKHNNASQHLSSLWIESEVRQGWEWVGSATSQILQE